VIPPPLLAFGPNAHKVCMPMDSGEVGQRSDGSACSHWPGNSRALLSTVIGQLL
jgi:hypothetical protein